MKTILIYLITSLCLILTVSPASAATHEFNMSDFATNMHTFDDSSASMVPPRDRSKLKKIYVAPGDTVRIRYSFIPNNRMRNTAYDSPLPTDAYFQTNFPNSPIFALPNTASLLFFVDAIRFYNSHEAGAPWSWYENRANCHCDMIKLGCQTLLGPLSVFNSLLGHYTAAPIITDTITFTITPEFYDPSLTNCDLRPDYTYYSGGGGGWPDSTCKMHIKDKNAKYAVSLLHVSLLMGQLSGFQYGQYNPTLSCSNPDVAYKYAEEYRTPNATGSVLKFTRPIAAIYVDLQ